MFRRKKGEIVNPSEQRFDVMMQLIKDLPKADYNRLKKAMDLGWQSYQTIRNVKTDDEKEIFDIEDVERKLKEDYQS